MVDEVIDILHSSYVARSSRPQGTAVSLQSQQMASIQEQLSSCPPHTKGMQSSRQSHPYQAHPQSKPKR